MTHAERFSRIAVRLSATTTLTVLVLALSPFPMWAQGTYQVIFQFGQHSNYGYQPWSGVVLDNYGNLYGNTEQGGQYGSGTVYTLLRTDTGRSYITLHSFPFRDPAANPVTTVVRDLTGHLFGTGGSAIYELSPTASIAWSFSELYQFSGGTDGDCRD